MNLSDELTIPAPRTRVYEALQDPEILRRCIPGCEELTKVSDTGLEAKVALKIGPIKARFSGNVTLNPENPPQNFSLSGEGNGGIAGFARGGATVQLEDLGEETRLRYEATAEIGGKLAQLGSRLIQGTAKKLAAQFFESLKSELTVAQETA